ncbi:MAG TPA: type III-B CRISPR module-associated protein Cmr5 [Pyrinomonadaceae bacterium]|nr:type III-B CRISPR module-associated protein Cmr5 [Pyrinomonadaceae bacterium]HLE62654.1 type III-B CRISPR module-associated protein Cmr5 [Pyrinomonadaceae bacterium]
MRTRDQRYGADIYKQIRDEVAGKGDPYRNAYGSMAHKLPILVRSAGLAQALAFVEARGKEEHKALLHHLAKVVLKNDMANGASLALKSRNTTDLSEYVYLTKNVMTALTWYKRFAQSVLDVDPSEAASEEVED